MPRLSDQMEEGTIIKWLVEAGRPVSEGDELLEIETDKATGAYEAEAEGVLEIVVAEGETVAVGTLIARLGDGPRKDDDAAEPDGEDDDADQDEQLDKEGPLARPDDDDDDDEGRLEPAKTGTVNGAAPSPTPLARRAAAVHDVDLADVAGTGPRGRITKGDVFAAAGLESSDPEPAATPATDGTSVQEPTRLQQIVAKRMTEAATTVPHFQVATEVTMDAAVALRAVIKAAAGERPAPSVNDLIVKACARALGDHPLVNGSFKDGAFELHGAVHVGMAVATDEGLVVATIRDADRRSLTEVAAESRRLAERVRAGKASAAELSSATFTVSNLGMFGMTQITAVINPPQAAILGVGSVRDTLARDESGEIVDRKLLTLNLSCDHRILNGADGSRFLADVKAALEHPHGLAF